MKGVVVLRAIHSAQSRNSGPASLDQAPVRNPQRDINPVGTNPRRATERNQRCIITSPQLSGKSLVVNA